MRLDISIDLSHKSHQSQLLINPTSLNYCASITCTILCVSVANKYHIYPTVHHTVTEMCTCVYISVTTGCLVRYLSEALWDLWDGSLIVCYRQPAFRDACQTSERLDNHEHRSRDFNSSHGTLKWRLILPYLMGTTPVQEKGCWRYHDRFHNRENYADI